MYLEESKNEDENRKGKYSKILNGKNGLIFNNRIVNIDVKIKEEEEEKRPYK